MDIEFKNNLAYISGIEIDNTFILVSNGDWFVENSICFLKTNYGKSGALVIGNRRIETETEAKNNNKEIGDLRILDCELCPWEEFDIYDNKRNLLIKGI